MDCEAALLFPYLASHGRVRKEVSVSHPATSYRGMHLIQGHFTTKGCQYHSQERSENDGAEERNSFPVCLDTSQGRADKTHRPWRTAETADCAHGLAEVGILNGAQVGQFIGEGD